jgi:hypothetical protein
MGQISVEILPESGSVLSATQQAVYFVEINQAAHPHFAALRPALVSGVIALRHAAKNGLGLLPGLFWRQGAVSTYCDEPLGCGAAAAFGTISDNERLGAALLHAHAKSGYKAIPDVVPVVPCLGGVHNPLREKNPDPLGHVSSPTYRRLVPNPPCFGQHLVNTVNGNCRYSLAGRRVVSQVIYMFVNSLVGLWDTLGYPRKAPVQSCQGWGRGFESLRPLQFFPNEIRVFKRSFGAVFCFPALVLASGKQAASGRRLRPAAFGTGDTVISLRSARPTGSVGGIGAANPEALQAKLCVPG